MSHVRLTARRGWVRLAAGAAIALLVCASAVSGQTGLPASEGKSLGLPSVVPAAAGEKKAGGSGLPTTLALGGVVGLALVTGGVVRLVARKRGGVFATLGAGGRAPAGIMEIIGRYPVGRGCTLVLLKLDRRILLLSQSATGRFGAQGAFTTLAEITDPEEVGSILLKSRDAEGDSMSERFRSILGRFEKGMDGEVAPSGGRRMSRSAAGDRVEVWDDRSGIPVIDLTRNREAGAAGALRKRLAQLGGGMGGGAR